MQICSSHREKIQKHLEEVYSLPPPNDEDYTLSTYFSGHDKAVVIAKGKEILEVIEGERLHNLKNGDWETIKVAENYPTNSFEHTTVDMYNLYNDLIYRYIYEKYKISEIKTYLGGHFDAKSYRKSIKITAHHHSSHALGAFYQSPFKEALTITYDGGSPDHIKIGIFYMRRGKRPILVNAFDNTIVGRYQDLGLFFDCFKWQPEKAAHFLPGKIMALASFGKPNLKLLDVYKSVCSGSFTNNAFEGFNLNPDDFYITKKMRQLIDTNHFDYTGSGFTKENMENYYKIVCSRLSLLYKLLLLEGITNAKELAPLGLAHHGLNYLKFFNEYDKNIYKDVKRIPNEKAFNMAATLQLACEELFFDNLRPFLEKNPKIPLVLAGGGALNIILNTRIKKETGREVFVGPDSSDCGLALGAMLGYLRPEKPYSNPYTGVPILDINMLGSTLMEYVGLNTELSKYSVVKDVRSDIPYIAKLILEGKIIGVMRGNSERGPRALGNRSIICSASLPHIKDTLNAKVKFREWFRPFAPIVRLQDVNKYFDWEGESRYMNFCIDVREEYQDKLQAITHVDGTARVQTITREQNWFIYDILTELDKLTGIGVIVNTSFNVNGRPLINSVRDAFYMLENTQLDGIIVQSTLVLKK